MMIICKNYIVLDTNEVSDLTLIAGLDENSNVVKYVVAMEYIPEIQSWRAGNYFCKSDLKGAINLLYKEKV